MTPKLANAAYDILVADAGASEINRNDFLAHVLSGCREYRCCHALGVGGKFRPETMTVDYYSEDVTPERDEIMLRVNRKLAELATP